MRSHIRKTLLVTSLALLTGCSGIEVPPYAEATQHYRSVERFNNISVEVGPASGLTTAPAEFRALPDAVTRELVTYLNRSGINTNAGGGQDGTSARARLVADISYTDRALTEWGRRMYLRTAPGDKNYSLVVWLFDPEGNVVEEAKLYHKASDSSAAATAQQLAELIADDMLLIWHPAVAAVGEKWSAREPAPFTLLPSPGDPQGAGSRIAWETFPSERVLLNADFAASDISQVSYEIRMFPAARRAPTLSGLARGLATVRARDRVYRVAGITVPEHSFPFTLPSCEAIIWSVRAHFRLNGHPRVTEWSGNYSAKTDNIQVTGPPYFHRRVEYLSGSRIYNLWHQTGGGTRVYVDAPEPLQCRKLMRAREVSVTRLEIEPLPAGQSIATINLASEICGQEGCETRAGVGDTSENLAACLVNEFARRELGVPVRDMAKLLSDLPTPPAAGSGEIGSKMDATTFLDSLRLPENRAYLQARGIRYVITTRMSLHASPGGEVESNGWLTVMDVATHYVSSINTSIIDVMTGNVVGTIATTAQGEKGVVVPVFIIIPFAAVPHGSRARIEEKACDVLARRLSFSLRGGISGWPEEYFKDAYAPMWEPIETPAEPEVATEIGS